jgi:hypothetical protein
MNLPVNTTAMTFVLVGAALAAAVAARRFERADPAWRRWLGLALGGGLVAGAASALATAFLPPPADIVLAGLAIASASLSLQRHFGERDLLGAILTGHVAGAGAALAAAAAAPQAAAEPAFVLLAVAPVTSALFTWRTSLPDLLRAAAITATAAGAAALALGARLLLQSGIAETVWLLTAAAFIAPVVAIAGTFLRGAALGRELEEELARGFIDLADLPLVTRPLSRLRPASRDDRSSRHHLIHCAIRIALRKKEARMMPPGRARLVLLELMQLRARLLEITRIRRSVRDAETNPGAGRGLAVEYNGAERLSPRE